MGPDNNGNDKPHMSANARMALIATCVVLAVMIVVALLIVAKKLPEKAAMMSGDNTNTQAPVEEAETAETSDTSEPAGAAEPAPSSAQQYSDEDFKRDESELNLDDVYSWYVGQIWNPITDFDAFIKNGKNSAGEEFDTQAEFDEYVDSIEQIGEYTDYIHEYHPGISETWDKMMEQVNAINAKLDLGFDVGTEPIDIKQLEEYNDTFFKYANENRYW